MRSLDRSASAAAPFLLLLIALALLVRCDSGATGTAPQPAAPDAGASAAPATETPADTVATPGPSATATARPGSSGAAWRIVLGDAQRELAVRTVCSDDYPASAPGPGLRDGDAVTVISAANAACRGWALVRMRDDRSSWVRLRYLDGPALRSWPLDLVEASWGDLLALLDDEQRDCITRALLASELAGAETARLLDGDPTQRWEQRFFACLDQDLANAVGYARVLGNAEFTLGVLPDEARACIRRFVNEVIDLDRQALLTDAGALAEAITVQNLLRPLCLREPLIAFAAALLVERFDLERLDPNAGSCLRASPVITNVALAPFGGSVITLEAPELMAVVVSCAPTAMLAVAARSLLPSPPAVFTPEQLACIRGDLSVEDISAALLGTASQVNTLAERVLMCVASGGGSP